MMTKQERQVQLEAIVREVEGHETALVNLAERLEEAEDRNDEDEVKFLKKEIASSERTIKAAKEQIELLTDKPETRQQKARTSSRSPGRTGSKTS